jgi:hypothetical protein
MDSPGLGMASFPDLDVVSSPGAFVLKSRDAILELFRAPLKSWGMVLLAKILLPQYRVMSLSLRGQCVIIASNINRKSNLDKSWTTLFAALEDFSHSTHESRITLTVWHLLSLPFRPRRAS